MQITNSKSSLDASGFVDLAPQGKTRYQLAVGRRQSRNSCREGFSHGTVLTSRQVTHLNRALLSEKTADVFARAANEDRRCHPQIEEDEDMEGHILAGRDDCIVKLIQQGHSLNSCDDNIIAPVVTAATYGSVKTLLTLLRHGADPNSCNIQPMPTGHMHIEHVLQRAENVDKIVLLLSYGADTKPLEMNYAFVQERSLHLLVYFHWQQYCQKLGHLVRRPETVDQLNELVSQLPVSEIQATVDLFERNHWSVNHPPEIPPRGLEAFWSFLTGPVD